MMKQKYQDKNLQKENPEDAQNVQDKTEQVKEEKQEIVQVTTEKPKTNAVKPEVVTSGEVTIETVKPAEIDKKTGQLMLTPKHIELIKTQIAKDANPAEFELFMMMAYRTRLDPLLKQLYFIKYGGRVSYVTSIDGYRIIAHRTGDFAGVDEPKFEYDKAGKITHCTITVYKLVQSVKCAFTAKVKFDEYTTKRDNWVKLAETMIAKVAEAHALRKAFPQDLNGIYTNDEMEQAGVAIDGKTGKVINQKAPIVMIRKSQVVHIKELMEEKGIQNEKLKAYVEKYYKVDSMAKMTEKQADQLIANLKKMADKPQEPELPEDAGVFDGEELPPDDSFESFVNSENASGPSVPDGTFNPREVDELLG